MGSLPPPTRKLFTPIQIGTLTLSNRIIMAPLTRFRASDTHTILPLAAEYYAQRARAYPGTLLISEACVIHPSAGGNANVPGIYNAEQIAAWKAVTDAVHKEGGYMYCQLWALGRVANPEVLKAEGSGNVVSSSPTAYEDGAPVPRALTEDEITQYITWYALAAQNALAAGFDGVEIHAANGYLIDQFTQDTCNARADRWGGSVAHRARFALEVTRAVVDAVGADRTGIRLSPWSPFQGMKMADPIPQFTHLTAELAKHRLAYLHLVESRISGNADVEATEKNDPLVDVWGKTSPILIAGGLTPESARRIVDEEYADKEVGVVFGRYFISNPDLVFRVKKGVPLRKYEREVFYKVKSEVGYADYEFCEEWKREHEALA
ncbi:hypothetical protein M409DRAFT_18337 [Zasmidium cellare ATCC 36951]|uniref:NADH:flavin oxidoreductase/NADH oxidase N-terminal domain-containing protein n=1 Tax=Zasmidium cellare ATCC 36951 TaxID=1080233 RepID=A0A6A6CYF0_ZASCE|nr:uncharacterized protein M409DRAFT_18337 [Zasmidium cellare ATCC 36951]KAF2171220.1 hypothetical protein M409DRAFT_18337 [Zasmidium cellare ATCC 36951]